MVTIKGIKIQESDIIYKNFKKISKNTIVNKKNIREILGRTNLVITLDVSFDKDVG